LSAAGFFMKSWELPPGGRFHGISEDRGLMIVISLLTRKSEFEEDLSVSLQGEAREKTGLFVLCLWLVLALRMIGLYGAGYFLSTKPHL